MEAWETILFAFGGNAALIAVLGFLGKSLLEKLIEKDTERFKADLKAKSDSTIEQLKNALEMKATEHQIRFSNLHEKRAETIAEAYALLADLHADLSNYVKIFEQSGEKSKEDRRKDLEKSHKNFITYYRKKRIFLPKEAVTIIDEINKQTIKAFYEFFYSVELTERTNPDVKMWMGIFEKVNQEMPLALSELEDKFRLVLGDQT